MPSRRSVRQLPGHVGVLILCLLPSGASDAASRDYVYTARTEGGVRTSGTVTAGGIPWQCSGSSCTATGPWPKPGVGSCAALAREVGRIVSYGHPKAQLDKAQLDNCNRGVTATTIPPSSIGIIVGRPTGTVIYASGRDCDDHRADVHPGAPEVCDGRDNDCDGEVDEGLRGTAWLDRDGDAHGDPQHERQVCLWELGRRTSEGAWWVLVGNDCDDTDPDRWRDC